MSLGFSMVFVLISSAFFVSLVLMVALRPIASRLGLVDLPGGRKTHSGEIPIIGGVAIFAGLLSACMVEKFGGPAVGALLAASALLVAVGLLDDFFELPPVARLSAHFLASLTLVLATGQSVESFGNLVGLGDIELGVAAPVFTVVAIVALVNAFNMLDGLDGLAGGVGLVAFCGFALLAGFLARTPGAGSIALGMVGAACAFLVFNMPLRFNRHILSFMGDSGSTLLGFLLAGLGLMAVQDSGAKVPPVVVLLLMPIPVLELFTSTFRRLRRRVSPLTADREHFHHRWLDAGYSIRGVFVIYLLFSLISAVIGLLATYTTVPESALFVVFLGMAAVWLLAVHNAGRLLEYLPPAFRRDPLPPMARFAAGQPQSEGSA